MGQVWGTGYGGDEGRLMLPVENWACAVGAAVWWMGKIIAMFVYQFFVVYSFLSFL